MISGAKLRFARQARGYSQQQLAGMAGVSRQAVSAVESGLSDPSLRVALALAQALGMTVEELFGAEGTIASVSARMVGQGGLGASQADTGRRDTSPVSPQAGQAGARVTLASVGDSFVALPLAGPTVSRAGFLPAGGMLAEASARGGTEQPEVAGQRDVADQPDAAGQRDVAGQADVAVRPIGPPRPTLVVAGCDPALPLLEEPLSLLDPPIGFSWWPCSSQEALRLAGAGLVHAAGAHLRDRSGEYNTESAAELLATGGQVIGFSAWREGLVLGPDAREKVGSVGDVVARGLRLVNREPGAEARRVLDRELDNAGIEGSHVPGYQTMAAGHLQVADAISAGLADVGVASEPAALAYGHAFVPIAAERFDLVIPAAHAASREVQALLKVLGSRWLLDQLASLPGYDPASCGQHIATLGAS
ncbi:MAG: helix-turn-helix domain-containing protein [Nocardiopsaceae bacterium]|jgi:molybdate-binding protein/DNA-binding XRE family transcriptional regulator|nr:helix-turn-helix domain-containing protein [Nocardiopsaceae bacterium]